MAGLGKPGGVCVQEGTMEAAGDQLVGHDGLGFGFLF